MSETPENNTTDDNPSNGFSQLWIDKKNELEESLSQSYKRCTPMVVAMIISTIGLLMIPVPNTQNGMTILWVWMVFHWIVAYKMFRFLKIHAKIRREYYDHIGKDNPFK